MLATTQGQRLIIIAISIALLTLPIVSYSLVKGIYITQPTLENTRKINYFIKRAKEVGIDTFIIDVKRRSSRYKKNIALVKRHGIKYVARVVVFPYGGSHAQVTSKRHWQKKYRLAEYAIALGANEIQLDYIRYRVKGRWSRNNSNNIYKVIKWFKQRLKQHGVPLQIAVFGETTHHASRTIGQDLRLFAGSIDVLNPMLYPSHYEPYRYHAKRPYQTVLKSLNDLRRQFNNRIPFKVYAYIELYNYRYRLSRIQRYNYIRAQIKAVKDGGADGWYAWSARNRYDSLFTVLRSQ